MEEILVHYSSKNGVAKSADGIANSTDGIVNSTYGVANRHVVR